MESALEAIRLSIDPSASPEAQAAGAQACRAILATLESSPVSTMTAAPEASPLPIAQIVGALRGVPMDQLLDLAISRLRAVLPPGITGSPVQSLKFQLVPLAPSPRGER